VRFNWLDYVLVGTVATVAAVQFLRSTRDFSRVLYETLFTVGAVVAASMLLGPLGQLTSLPQPLLFGGSGLVLVVIGFLLGALLNAFAAFELGIFSYVFGLVLAVVCGYALGHFALRTADMAISPRNAQFADAVRHSLVARDLLRFRTIYEILVFLRFVRWKGM
jgi:uncharacterized membrane protein YeaQ/YmgE (transglycosylase-associated protein family)